MEVRNMRELVTVLKALADPMRIRVLKLLEEKKMCVCELTVVLGIQQSSVSHHLRILRDAGLVDDLRNGPWIDYQLAQSVYNEFAPTLLKIAKTWLNEEPIVRQDVKAAKRVDRKQVCHHR
jgi:ArsR family transcriptional regulator